MKRIRWIAALLLCLLLVSGCAKQPAEPVFEQDARAQGTDTAAEPQATEPLKTAETEQTAEPQAAEEPTAAPQAQAEAGYAQRLAAAFEQTGALDQMAQFSDMDLLDYYGIDPAACISVVGYTDAVGYTNEIVIVEADAALAEQIESLLADYLEARKAQFAGYDADAVTLVEQAVLRRDGGVVLMIVSPDAEALLQVYREFAV